MRFAAPLAEFAVSEEMLFGAWGWAFWAATAMFILSCLILLSPLKSDIRGIVISGVLCSVALWLKRIVIIVPPLIRSRQIFYPPGVYFPTLIEWTITIGTFIIGTLIITAFIKLFPIIELEVVRKGADSK